jgi:hypothetical protein
MKEKSQKEEREHLAGLGGYMRIRLGDFRKWLDICTLTIYRSLCTSSKILSYKPKVLVSLTALQYLSIDLAQEGLSTQHPRLKALLGYLEAGASTSLITLTLSSLPRIDALLLKLIAMSFPRLTDLYLSCTERLEFNCCWSCFEDSLGCTIHSPIPNDYIDFAEMAVSHT